MSPLPPTPDPGADPAGADPSMEDILASIRRILNEDDAPGSSSDAAPQAAEPEPAASASPPLAVPISPVTAAGSAGDDEDVLVLDEGMLVSPAPEPPALVPTPAPSQPMALPASATESFGEGLLAPESAAAAASSVSSLLRTLSSERSTQVYRGGPTIEDLVREELRPLLKAWLDQQLPPMVERLVRQEIERVVGKATDL